MDVLPEDVAYAVNSPVIIAAFSHFFPQLLHQSINGPHITCIVVLTRRIQYGISWQNNSRMLHEVNYQIKFFPGGGDMLLFVK